LHGVYHRNPDRPPLDTDGCLALRNVEISRLKGVLEPHVTPVIVARKLAWTTPDQLRNTRLEFRLALDTWQESLATGDLDTYLSLYADDFRYRDLDRDEWVSYSSLMFESRPLAGVRIDDVMLLADPEEPGLYLSRFTEELLTKTGPQKTTKRLYWRRSADKDWAIVSEDSEQMQNHPYKRYAASFRRRQSEAVASPVKLIVP